MSNREKNMELTLCPSCARQFCNSRSHFIRRLDPYQVDKDTCSYCGIRSGWDYIIMPRTRRRNKFSSQWETITR